MPTKKDESGEPFDLMTFLEHELSPEAFGVAKDMAADTPALLAHLEQHLPPASLGRVQQHLGVEL